MTIKIANTQYFYKEEGKGEPILLIHGNPDTADFWDDLVPLLSPQYRCIRPDLPGFGRSDIALDFEFTLDGFQDWLNTFITALGIKEPLHLIVHDVGAFYGLPWAINHPEKVRSICVSNTGFFSDYRWHFLGRVWRTPILGELANLLMNKTMYKNGLKRDSPTLSDAFLENSYSHITRKMQRTVLKLYRAMSSSVFKGWEDKYLVLTTTKPVVVIWGENDPYIPLTFGYAERMANGQTVHRIPNVGHWVAAEVPEQFADYWLRFAEAIEA